MDDHNQDKTSNERGGAEAAAERANNPGPPASEPPTAKDSRGINPVQHSERGINPVQHSERGHDAGGEGKGGGE